MLLYEKWKANLSRAMVGKMLIWLGFVIFVKGILRVWGEERQIWFDRQPFFKNEGRHNIFHSIFRNISN